MRSKKAVKLPPGSVDLFGNVTPIQTWTQEYKEYINSSAWKKKCTAAIARAKNKCEKCGRSGYAIRLDVHHKTYDHFKNEPPEDLKVVCTKCHKIEDWLRSMETARRNREKLNDARFDGWARKVYGDDWMVDRDEDVVRFEFEDWIMKNDY